MGNNERFGWTGAMLGSVEHYTLPSAVVNGFADVHNLLSKLTHGMKYGSIFTA